MTPAARIQAAIELLGEIAATDAPADRTVGRYTRARRYIGSKDRRAIADMVYAVGRSRARLGWWIAPGGVAADADPWRRLTIAALVLIEGKDRVALDGLFDGKAYHPAPLDAPEGALVTALAGHALDDAEQARAVRLELPDWLLPRLEAAFGPDLDEEMAALNREAPLDLRVNTLKADRAAAIAALAEAGIDAAPTPISPYGLRVTGRHNLGGSRAYADGLVEVQDEGSQIVALLVGARPGMAVADACAGAGGKTLALAAAMENQGRLVAFDVAQDRLDRSAARLRRAGATIVERELLRPDADMSRWHESFDRVLVDAPCSGSGAWRRQPDARWRLTPEKLAEYRAAQAEALAQAAALVRPGGRLIYATCSVLPEENQDQVAAFLDAQSGFALVPAERAWAETIGAPPPAPAPAPFRDGYLMLTPARPGTDGFFAAVFERTDAP